MNTMGRESVKFSSVSGTRALCLWGGLQKRWGGLPELEFQPLPEQVGKGRGCPKETGWQTGGEKWQACTRPRVPQE